MPSPSESVRQRRSELLGHSLPVWPQRSLNRLPPVFLTRRPCSWMRLLERLSLEVQLSFTVSTRTTPLPSYRKLLSWVFLRPFSASSIGDPRSSRLPVQTPQHLFRLGFRQKLPNLPATVPLAGFFNLSADSFSPTPSHHFQAGNALGVSPFRGFPFRAAPYGFIAASLPS